MQDAIRFINGVLVYFFLQGSSLVHATPTVCDASIANPCIVQDHAARDTYPRSLRHAAMIADYFHGSLIGVDELYLSGSAEPSELGWRDIATYIATRKPTRSQAVVVLDLRQESHGYLNGQAITLVVNHNWINLGKTNDQSLMDEDTWLKLLNTNEEVVGVLTPEQYENKEYSQGKKVRIKAISTEADLVDNIGFKYQRLLVTDHMGPTNSEVDALVRIFKSNPRDTWYHVHCRAGRGRTTTVFVMYDMLNNANKVSFDDIIARNASIPPFYDLAQVNKRDPELTTYYIERLEFLRAFYEYSKQSIMGYKGTWTEWREDLQT